MPAAGGVILRVSVNLAITVALHPQTGWMFSPEPGRALPCPVNNFGIKLRKIYCLKRRLLVSCDGTA